MDDANAKRTRAFYETVAVSYAELVPDTSFESGTDLAMIADFIDQLGDDQHIDVLDAGCGSGRMIGYLRSLSDAITPIGLDLSPAMLRHARAAHPDVQFLEGSLAALPFDDQAFDGVLAWYSIIHTPPHQLPQVFAEFQRVLRPDGLALLGYQSGTGERTLTGAYGHDVELHAFLHHTGYVAAALQGAGFIVDARVDRGPRRTERRSQGFVLARCSPADG